MPRVRLSLPALAAVAPADARDDSAAAPARGAFARSAYDSIRGAILDCTLLPGMALSEQALSEGLGVSRAPVRDALRQLVAEGLVESFPQRGTFVSRLNRARIADAIFVREAIECRAVELACDAPLAQRRELLGIVRTQSAASSRRDYAGHLQADEDFHHRILLLAGHPHAWGPLRLARTGMNRVRHLAIPQVGSHRIAVDHHRLIVDAIIAADRAAAREAMRVHIQSPLAFLEAIRAAKPEFFDGE